MLFNSQTFNSIKWLRQIDLIMYIIFPAAQDDVLDIQSTSNVKVNFISTTPLLPGVYTQELIVRPETCAIR